MARLTPAVMRTFDILELFLADDTELSAAEVVKLTGLPRTSVHELINTLVAREYLEKDESRGVFRLGVRLLQLGNAYSARFDMLAAANEVARMLSDRLGETVSVALRQGAEVFYLAKIEARDIVRMPSSIGKTLPANATALGKALLAALTADQVRVLFPDGTRLPKLTANSIGTIAELEAQLEQVRHDGVAFEREESAENVTCVAAPVRDASGAVVAAISTSVPVPRWEQQPQEHWVEAVRDGAEQLSIRLGYRAPKTPREADRRTA
ncbi:IclR family transcriptional regulator [Ruicaihuangia caeni]|uniref:IclR family transcriptional regulator n=1 Tax=Ruicaihuangia caeni TaxID=3042517 RepID=A0AAW6TAE9_9MICO|nr:IclR family transcriptional regulator [Klugiella sp. YN-L-19]MDI2099040.1 IclR family transcriptional regulator [Klugiella sp. YN-L-19]